MRQKYNCYKCSKMAVWYYMPCSSGKVEHESYICDDHIHRGCSCNIIKFDPDPNKPEDFEQFKDEQGRLLPCCEYDYSEAGFDKEVLVEKYEDLASKYDGDDIQ